MLMLQTCEASLELSGQCRVRKEILLMRLFSVHLKCSHSFPVGCPANARAADICAEARHSGCGVWRRQI